MVDYETGRNSEHASRLHNSIEDFASRFGGNPSINDRRTIFLFPGGLGSQLMRANKPPGTSPPR